VEEIVIPSEEEIHERKSLLLIQVKTTKVIKIAIKQARARLFVISDIVICNLFGIWNLEFGISRPAPFLGLPGYGGEARSTRKSTLMIQMTRGS
jgi:hypothetical protein